MKIPSLIKAQDARHLSVVLGVGEFKLKWHLSADLKTIKYIYGLGRGACAKHCCIYCSQEKAKFVTIIPKIALAAFTKQASNT
jgi:hypothetical protein